MHVNSKVERTLSIPLLLTISLAHAQSPGKANEPAAGSIKYSTIQQISDGDSGSVSLSDPLPVAQSSPSGPLR